MLNNNYYLTSMSGSEPETLQLLLEDHEVLHKVLLVCNPNKMKTRSSRETET